MISEMKNFNIMKSEINPFSILAEQWMLLCSGELTSNNFNFMTVAWGSFGTMWFKPFVMVVVRPTRHTYSFMESFDDFTLSAFPEAFKEDLTFCGKNSGRNINKLENTKLTAMPSEKISSPGFEQAELILECKKIYSDSMKPEYFLDPSIEQYYPDKDYHKIYFGEVVNAKASFDVPS